MKAIPIGMCLVLTVLASSHPIGARAWAGTLVNPTDAPLPVIVVLPSGYGSDGARWPVVYLLNTVYDGCGNQCDPIVAALEEQGFITVLERPPRALSDYIDWYDGSQQFAELYAENLVAWTDATFATIADRAHRAIGGISAGGYGASVIAAQHPDVFSVLATFSGPDDILADQPLLQAEFFALGSESPINAAPWGVPVLQDLGWHENNAADLAMNLRHTETWMSSGPGIPCDAADVTNPATPIPIATVIEKSVREASDGFDRALVAADAPHTTIRYDCGVHGYRYFVPNILRWLDTGVPFGAGIPGSFDYRSARPEFSLYGWTVTADPMRAKEFLDLAGASREGFTLTGSGLASVTTAALFDPGQQVSVLMGGRAQTMIADSDGRLSLSVDLGPPHADEQFSPKQRVAESAGYFRTVAARFD